MNHRNIEIKVRLNRKGSRSLKQESQKSRISREAYLRHLINGVVRRTRPRPNILTLCGSCTGSATT